MPIAAVPAYLGQDFGEASPGLRFTLLLPIWAIRLDQEIEVREAANRRSHKAAELKATLEEQGMDAAIAHMKQRWNSFPGLWGKHDGAVRKVWAEVGQLNRGDKDRMAALVARQDALAATHNNHDRFAIDAKAVAPFTTGLGNEHPLENGFAFLNPHGLPYLPGSGVKGVLRQSARELASDVTGEGLAQWDIESGWTSESISALFGNEDSDKAQRGALRFWDVIPLIEQRALMVEVMTVHQREYYQNDESPHESGQPTPINFLTVPPGSKFTFHVFCDRRLLARLAPGLLEGERWHALLRQAFKHAFEWLGFGAKTAVGYGAMTVDTSVEAQRQKREESERKAEEEAQRIKEMTADLPKDAAQLVEAAQKQLWTSNDYFLEVAEKLLEEQAGPSTKAQQLLREELATRWPGLMEDPGAVQGKKEKPKYKPRPKAIAVRLLELSGGNRV